MATGVDEVVSIMKSSKGLSAAEGIGLGMAVCLLASLGTRWAPFLAPVLWWLRLLLEALVVMVAALGLAVWISPRRPGPTAALVGALVGFGAAMPAQLWTLQTMQPSHPSGQPLADSLALVAQCWNYAAVLGVSCWLVADRWRAASWCSFWAGAGGAVARGGTIAGAISLPILISLHAYSGIVIDMLLGIKASAPDPLAWAGIVAQSLSGIPKGMVVTALLAAFRPSPLRGALAGMGILLSVAVVSLYADVSSHAYNYAVECRPLLLPTVLLKVVPAIAIGGIAGSYAARWTKEGGSPR